MPFARKLQVSMNTPSLAGLRLQSQLLNKMTESTYSYAVFVQCQDHFFIPLVLRTLLKIKSLVFLSFRYCSSARPRTCSANNLRICQFGSLFLKSWSLSYLKKILNYISVYSYV